MADKSLWLVSYAVRSATATVVVVEADSERQAKEAAVGLEDPDFVQYVRWALDDDRMTADPIRPGLRVHVGASY